jgi:hypothetical protein
MYCVSCQTPFSWNTGKIVTSGVIHNPHYYEWLKRNGQSLPRNPGDVPCGGYPRAWELRRFPRGFPQELERRFMEFHRICLDIQAMAAQNWQSHLQQDANNRINIQFLLNEYDEKRWGQLLAIQERKRKRDRDIQEVFAAFQMVSVELINRYQNHHENGHAGEDCPVIRLVEQLSVEINALVEMINDAFKRVSLQHHAAVPQIRYGKGFGNRYHYQVHNHNFYTEKRDTKKKEAKDGAEGDADAYADADSSSAAAAASTVVVAVVVDSDEEDTESDEDDSESDNPFQRGAIHVDAESIVKLLVATGTINKDDEELQEAIERSLHFH